MLSCPLLPTCSPLQVLPCRAPGLEHRGARANGPCSWTAGCRLTWTCGWPAPACLAALQEVPSQEPPCTEASPLSTVLLTFADPTAQPDPDVRKGTRPLSCFSPMSFKFFFLIFLGLFIFEKETEHGMGEGQREKGRQRIPSRLCTDRVEPDAGLEPTHCKIMT